MEKWTEWPVLVENGCSDNRTRRHIAVGQATGMSVGYRASILGRPMSAPAAQEPVSQENRRPRLNDRSRVSGIDECPNWTSSGNDRSGELDGNSWLAAKVRLRCVPVSQRHPTREILDNTQQHRACARYLTNWLS